MKQENKRIFMKPGKTNKEDRLNFIKYWIKCMNSMSDKEWSKQQNIVIDSQFKTADHKTYFKLYKQGKLGNSKFKDKAPITRDLSELK